MHGPVSYCLEREPEFFALTRLQGDGCPRVAVVEEGKQLIAMAMMAPHDAWVGGAAERVAYLGDLKVDPDYRNRGLARRVINFVAAELDRVGVVRSYFLVLAGNPAFEQVGSGSEDFSVTPIRRIRNYLIPFARRRRSEVRSGVTIMRGTGKDLPEIVATWNRVNGRRTFAPLFDEPLLATRMAASCLGDFTLVRRNGALVAFGIAWDAAAIKQVRLLRLSRILGCATAAYDLAAPLLHRPRLPRPGEHLRFLYLSHACAEEPRDLAALLAAVRDTHASAGYLYLDLALDAGDALTAALPRVGAMKVDFDLWEALTPARREAKRVDADQCAYFDVSIV
jgi:GNAT superfamily N-acetyltransferase